MNMLASGGIRGFRDAGHQGCHRGRRDILPGVLRKRNHSLTTNSVCYRDDSKLLWMTPVKCSGLSHADNVSIDVQPHRWSQRLKTKLEAMPGYIERYIPKRQTLQKFSIRSKLVDIDLTTSRWPQKRR